jgi:Holliday junction resolvase RusA-like endonuclease
MTAEIVIPGKPVGKGRPRFRRAGEYVQTYTPKATAGYEALVRKCWKESGYPMLQGEIEAIIYAYFPIPKSTTKKRRALMESGAIGCGTKPDADNIAKAVLDALNGLAYTDDSKVTGLIVLKLYGTEPRVEVKLTERENAP